MTYYVRDILCLPQDWIGDEGCIAIPRGERRNLLAQSGLIGKLEFNSEMSDHEVRQEICKVFALPMDLDESDGVLFPFDYLQRTGAGSRTLCVPSVCSGFEWNGRLVSTLAKSGGMIYILAQAKLRLKELHQEKVFNIFT